MKTILIVDDQAGIRLLLEKVFTNEHMRAVCAANGEQALQVAKEIKADCVLLDMRMPGMTGIEVLKQLKLHQPDLPIVMLTAFEDHALIQEALSLGAEKYIVKPFDVLALKKTVENLLTY